MKDMKETRKMLEFYRSRIRINTFFMPISILLFILLGIVFFVMQIWLPGIILFVFGATFTALYIWAYKHYKRTMKRLEEELAEAEQILKNSGSKEENEQDQHE